MVTSNQLIIIFPVIVKCPLLLGEKKAHLVGVLGFLGLILQCCHKSVTLLLLK